MGFQSARLTTRQLILVSLFVALTAIGARISIPLPYVPFTFQTFFVLLAGMLLGPRLGALSQTCYAIIGLVGLPVFARGGGPGYLLQPTFGYILGFIPAAAVVGLLIERRTRHPFWRYLLASCCGMAVVYLLGLAYLWVSTNLVLGKELSVLQTLKAGLVILLPGAVIQGFLSALLGSEVHRRLGDIVGDSQPRR